MDNNDTTATGEATEGRLLEVGWLVAAAADARTRAVIARARERLVARLGELFARFDWRIAVVERPLAPHQAGPCEPSLLLQEGLVAQDERGWDFTFVITNADLQTYYKSYAFAMPSRALSVAVVSLARLAPPCAAGKDDNDDVAAARLAHVILHLLGDLNGVEHGDEPTDYMYRPDEAAGLDAMNHFNDDTIELLGAELEDVADIRLEERPQARATGGFGFYWQAIRHLRGDIVSAIAQAQPWQFPLRLNRLTTGAVSTLLILMMTAEAWDLGMSQPLGRMTLFSLAILTGTSVFVLRRQKLLLRRSRPRLSEQVVLTNVSISLVVFVGMATTYLLLMGLTLIFAQLLFSPALVAGWAGSVGGPIEARHYLALAQFVASLGILIGSLGASFEGHDYFRHVAYVDEEL